MNKKEVEQVLIIIKSGQEEALHIKLYKNGTICRRGCGATPQINITGISFTNNSELFDKLMEKVPQGALDTPVIYQDKSIDFPLEYIVAFYGVSKNDENGEKAQWSKSTGIRFLLDHNTSFRDTLLVLVDGLAVQACALTNSWYFDIVMMAVENAKSDQLPEQTIVTASKEEEEIKKDFANYMSQINKTDLQLFANDKIYLDKSDVEHKLLFKINGDTIRYDFVPVGIKGFKFAELNANTKKERNYPLVAPISQKRWWEIWK